MGELGVYEAMRTQRAVRRLRPDPIPDDVLHRVLEAASWAPTGGNAQPWRVIAVREPAAKKRLGELYAERWAGFAGQYRDRTARLPEEQREKSERMLRAGDYLAAHFHETPVILVFCFNPKNMAITDIRLDRVSIVGGASVYTAVENLLLAARSEGLGCVLTTLLCECEPEVRELLAIPEPWGTAAAVPLGYPVLRGHGPISRLPVEKLAFAERWDAALEPEREGST